MKHVSRKRSDSLTKHPCIQPTVTSSTAVIRFYAAVGNDIEVKAQVAIKNSDANISFIREISTVA